MTPVIMASTLAEYFGQALGGAVLLCFLLILVYVVIASVPAFLEKLITMGVASFFARRCAKDVIREYYRERARYEMARNRHRRPNRARKPEDDDNYDDYYGDYCEDDWGSPDDDNPHEKTRIEWC